MSDYLSKQPAVWFLAVRTGTGTDVFTLRLEAELRKKGIRAEITWLALRAEYAPWSIAVPSPPAWATVVHVNTWLHMRFIPRGLPVVATVHHAVHHPDAATYKGLLRTIYHRWWIAPNERRVLNRAQTRVAVSRFVKDSTRNTLLGVPVHIVYNGVDVQRFYPGRSLRRACEPFRLLFVGGWKPLKGVSLLAPILRQLGSRFVLYYTGGLDAEKDKNSMPSNMIDIGRLSGDEAVVSAMQSADALLFPSRSEGFGLVAAEAMACGLPVIASRSASLVEVVADGKTGILCNPDDVNSFVEAARNLANNDELYEQIADNARRWVVENFSDESMVNAYERIYKSLLAPERVGK